MNLSLSCRFRLIMLKIFGAILPNVIAQATKGLEFVYPCLNLSSEQRFNYFDREISRLDYTQSQLNPFQTPITNFFNVNFHITLYLSAMCRLFLSGYRTAILYTFLITSRAGNLLTSLVTVEFWKRTLFHEVRSIGRTWPNSWTFAPAYNRPRPFTVSYISLSINFQTLHVLRSNAFSSDQH
jgi:hypothetical protein